MIIKAPNKIITTASQPYTLFLAGSIEQGTAENWQDRVCNTPNAIHPEFNIINPRRDEWDSTWEQSYDNIHFRDQVIWEQNALKMADMVLFYFDPNSKSPITLLEFGQCIEMNKKMLVVCSPDFWRYGNIEVMCHLNQIPLYHSLDEIL